MIADEPCAPVVCGDTGEMLKGLVVKCIINDILDINDDAEGVVVFFDGVNFNGELFVGGHGCAVRPT